MSRSFLNGITTTSVLMTGAGGNAYRLYDTSQGTDAKYADIEIGGSGVSFRFLNDAYTSSNTWLQATRSSGYVIGQVTITAPTINLTGAVNIDAGTIDGTVIGGTTPAAGTFTLLTTTGSIQSIGGSVILNNASSNLLDFGQAGSGAPSYPARSAGCKVVLFDAAGASVDYALGIDTNTLWQGVPSSSQQFKWYAGTTMIASLSGLGALTTGSLAAGAATINGSLTATSGNVFSDVGRNRVDNGNMEVAQRTLPVTVSGAYSLDRWLVGWSAGAGSVAQGTSSSYTSRRQINPTVTGLTVGANAYIAQRIESARCCDLAGQSVTVQFNFAYTISAGATSFTAQLSYPTVVDNFASNTAIASVAFTPSGTAGTYTATFAVPSAATTGLTFQVVGVQATATGNLAMVMTSVQLEPGTVATPFERLDPEQNLRRCQRFFQGSGSLPIMVVSTNGTYGGTTPAMMWLPTTMRSVPTVQSPTTGYSTSVSAGGIMVWNNTALALTIGTAGSFNWGGLTADL